MDLIYIDRIGLKSPFTPTDLGYPVLCKIPTDFKTDSCSKFERTVAYYPALCKFEKVRHTLVINFCFKESKKVIYEALF